METEKTTGNRIVFLDWLRIIACFMVMVIHSSEPFYLGGEAPNIASSAKSGTRIVTRKGEPAG